MLIHPSTLEAQWDVVGALQSVECIDTDNGPSDTLTEEEARRLLEGLHDMGYYIVNEKVPA